MKLSIFQPIFKKYNYKQKGRFFCKVKNDILLAVYFEEICCGRILRIDALIEPMIFPKKIIGYHSGTLASLNKGFCFHRIKGEYEIKDIPLEQYERTIQEICVALDTQLLPFLDNLPLESQPFRKNFLSYADKYYQSIFEIKYNKDYIEAKRLLENLTHRRNYELSLEESQLLSFLQENDVESINKVLESLKKEFIKCNKRYVSSNILS